MPDAEIDALCREMLARFRVHAFDNVDVSGLIARSRLTRDDAVWIARRLMADGGSLTSYSAGQHLLRLLEPVDAR